MKTVKELLDKYSNEEILNRFFEKYEDQAKSIEGYNKALDEMRNITPIKTDTIVYCGLFGCHIKSPGSDTTYAISCGWEQFLGYNFRRATLDTLCNALYEMTFYGYSNEEVKKTWRDMFRSFEEIMDEIGDEELERSLNPNFIQTITPTTMPIIPPTTKPDAHTHTMKEDPCNIPAPTYDFKSFPNHTHTIKKEGNKYEKHKRILQK